MIEHQIGLMQELVKTTLGLFELVVSLIIRLCVAIIFVAIAINFIESAHQEGVRKEKKSIVETGTMILFFLGFYWILKSGIGVVSVESLNLKIVFATIGTAILIIGTVFNILGRLALGKNWANQVKIYKNQTLVQAGVYKIVRHPLYASLIWMFFGASLVFLSYTALLANILIFIPFMYYRASQEEKLLSEQFSAYKNYQQKVAMFFPKIGGQN